MKTLALLLLGLVLPLSGHALNIGTNCEELRSSVYETRYFANGNIKVQKADTGEPAAAAFHLLITIESRGSCHTVNGGNDSSFGFYSLGELGQINAYNASGSSLALYIPYQENHNGAPWPLLHMLLVVEQATGRILY